MAERSVPADTVRPLSRWGHAMTQKAAYSKKMADWLRRNRTDRRMNQADLAAAISVSEQSIRNWECGRGVPNAYIHACLKTYFKAHPAPDAAPDAQVTA